MKWVPRRKAMRTLVTKNGIANVSLLRRLVTELFSSLTLGSHSTTEVKQQ